MGWVNGWGDAISGGKNLALMITKGESQEYEMSEIVERKARIS